MKLNCVKCGAEIPAANINLDRMVAKCAVCNSLFSFDKEFASPAVLSRRQQFDVPRPERVSVNTENGVLTICLSWFTYKTLLFTVFAIFWNSFMFSMLTDMFSTDAGPGGVVVLFFPHFWAGIALIYYVLTGYLNETRVTIESGRLTVRHGPLPYWGNKDLVVSDIMQLYTKHNFSTWRQNWAGHYELHAVTGKNRHEKLLSGLDNPDYATFIEQEIEDYLGIEDYPVRGEYGRI
jgi:hypothetical protein